MKRVPQRSFLEQSYITITFVRFLKQVKTKTKMESASKRHEYISLKEIYKRLGCDNDITHVNRIEWPTANASYIYYDYDDEKIAFLGKTRDGFTDIDNVITQSHASSFGDLNTKTTVMDESVRKSFEFDAARLCLGTPNGIKEVTDVVSLRQHSSCSTQGGDLS